MACPEGRLSYGLYVMYTFCTPWIAQTAMREDLIPAQICHLLRRYEPTCVCLSSCLLLSKTWTGAALLCLTQCACHTSLFVCTCKPQNVVAALRYNIMCHNPGPVRKDAACIMEHVALAVQLLCAVHNSMFIVHICTTSCR